MCGITCFVQTSNTAESQIKHPKTSLHHRGPDAFGEHAVGIARWSVTLRHYRLAIRDGSTHGHQPMLSPRTGAVLAYNGELYNDTDLRRRLSSNGVVFRGGSDTETILAVYDLWGCAGLAQLEGMFALILVDPHQGQMLVARDALGIKPLYVGISGGTWQAASELRAFATDGGLDRDSLAAYLANGAVPAARSLRPGIGQIDPGVIAVADLAGLRDVNELAWPSSRWRIVHRRAWAGGGRHRGRSWAWPDAVAAVRTGLERSVQSHLVSDVPVGVFLSGGLDSGGVAAAAARARNGDLDTLTVGLAGEAGMDESAAAAAVAAHLGCRHTVITLPDSSIPAQAAAWFAAQDQPSIDGLNTYLVSGAVRRHGIVVALSGLGGDELFGGYPSFTAVPRLSRLLGRFAFLPAGLRHRAASLAGLGLDPIRRRKLADLAATRPDAISLTRARRRLFCDHDVQALCGRQPARREHAWLVEGGTPSGPPDDEQGVAYAELTGYLRDLLLVDADVMSMAHGLELRVPFLDLDLVEMAGSLPAAFLQPQQGRSKPLLRAAVAPWLPPAASHLPKQGFELPFARWLRGPLRELVEAGLASAGTALDPAAVQATWQGFLRRPAGPSWSRCLALASLGHWLARGRSAEPLP